MSRKTIRILMAVITAILAVVMLIIPKYNNAWITTIIMVVYFAIILYLSHCMRCPCCGFWSRDTFMAKVCPICGKKLDEEEG